MLPSPGARGGCCRTAFHRSRVRGYFYAWRNDRLLEETNRAFVEAARLAEGRSALPTAGVIDSQSVKPTESGGVGGHDSGKRVKGDTPGLLVGLVVHGAGMRNRPLRQHGNAMRLPGRGRRTGCCETCRRAACDAAHIFADGGYAGPKLCEALKATGGWTVRIVKRPIFSKAPFSLGPA